MDQVTATGLAAFISVFAIMCLSFRLISIWSSSPPGTMTRLNSASLDSDRNRRVPLHGIRIAMGLAFLAAGAFSWFTSIGGKTVA